MTDKTVMSLLKTNLGSIFKENLLQHFINKADESVQQYIPTTTYTLLFYVNEKQK